MTLCSQGPFIHLKLQKDLIEDGFANSLQAAAIESRKLREPKVAKLRGGFFSNASLVFQS